MRAPARRSFDVLPSGGSAGRVTDPGASQLASVQGREQQQIGQTLQGVGAAIGQEVERHQFKINQARVRETALQFREDMAEAEAEYSKFKGAELVAGDRPVMRDIEERLSQRRNELLEGISSPAAKEAFGATADSMFAGWSERAGKYEAAQTDFYIEQQRDGIIQASFETAVSRPEARTESLSSASDVLREKFEDQGFSGDRLDQLTKESMAKLTAGQVQTMLEAGQADEAKAFLEATDGLIDDQSAKRLGVAIKDKFAETRALAIHEGELGRDDLKALHEAGEIDDGDYLRHLGQVAQYERAQQAEIKAAETKLQARNFASLQVGIDDGRLTRADADAAYEAGRINPSQWSQAVRQANDKKTKTDSASAFMTMLSSGLPIDPTDSDTKKGADAAFNNAGGTKLFQEDFNQGLAVTAQFAQVGIIPETAESVLRGMKASGTPEQQMTAVNAIGQLYTEYPNAVDAAFTATEVAEAISYRDKLDAGIAPEQAYQALLIEREAANEKGGFTDIRLGRARAIAKDFELKDALKRRDADGVTSLFGSGPKVGSDAKAGNDFAGDELTEMMVLNDFKKSFQTYFIQHGDEKLAKRQAAAVIGRTVGRSKVNGGRAMMHPPEKYYSIGGDDDWMRDSLVKAVSEDRLESGGDTRFKDVELIADIQTAREVRSGQAPSYFVTVEERDGTKTYLPWRLDFTDERQAQIASAQADYEAGKVDALNDAKAQRIESAEQDLLRAESQLKFMKQGAGWNALSPEDQQSYVDTIDMYKERLDMAKGGK